MTKQYRNRKQISTAIDLEIYTKFKTLSVETRIPSTKLLDEALEDLLVKHGKLQKENKKMP